MAKGSTEGIHEKGGFCSGIRGKKGNILYMFCKVIQSIGENKSSCLREYEVRQVRGHSGGVKVTDLKKGGKFKEGL